MIHYWLEDRIDTRGRIAAGSSPGWAGRLDRHVDLLAAQGVERVYSLIEDGDFGVSIDAVRDALRGAGIDCVHHPIEDMTAPTVELAREIIAGIRADLDAGRTLYLHCIGGIGRTGTILACMLVEEGMDPWEAIDELRRRKPGSVQTRDQERFIENWRDARP